MVELLLIILIRLPHYMYVHVPTCFQMALEYLYFSLYFFRRRRRGLFGPFEIKLLSPQKGKQNLF